LKLLLELAELPVRIENNEAYGRIKKLETKKSLEIYDVTGKMAECYRLLYTKFVLWSHNRETQKGNCSYRIKVMQSPRKEENCST